MRESAVTFFNATHSDAIGQKTRSTSVRHNNGSFLFYYSLNIFFLVRLLVEPFRNLFPNKTFLSARIGGGERKLFVAFTKRCTTSDEWSRLSIDIACYFLHVFFLLFFFFRPFPSSSSKRSFSLIMRVNLFVFRRHGEKLRPQVVRNNDCPRRVSSSRKKQRV